MKYTAESNAYGSILSIFCFDESGGPICNGTCNDYLPTTFEYIALAQQAGILYNHLPCSLTWNTLEAVNAVEVALTSMPQPVLVHCFAGYASSGLTLLYLLKTKQLNCDELFARAYAIDYEFWNDPTFVQLASELSDCPSCCNASAKAYTRKTESPVYLSFWQAKRLTECVYISGQIRRDHICDIKKGGFHTIANFRQGTTYLGSRQPSQEEVVLLNVRSHVLTTYEAGGRQLRSNLLRTRVDPNRPNSYISNTSMDNFESRNECEFGDEIGYNARNEMVFLSGQSGIYYYFLPGM